MGYSYGRSSSGRYALCCDHCGKVGACKRPCPHGYCLAVALCKECNAGEPGREYKRYHVENHCKEKHEACVAKRENEARLLAAGEFLLCARVYADFDDPARTWVKHWFRGADGTERVRYARTTASDAIGTDCVTLRDFEARAASFGPVLETPPAGCE